MLLQKLKEYADEYCGDQPYLYAPTPVAWVVELKADGSLITPHMTSRIDPSSARGKRGLDLMAPEVSRSSEIQPLLLADDFEYTFGLGPRSGRATAYRKLLAACVEQTSDAAVIAVHTFVESGGGRSLALNDEVDLDHKVTFRVHLPTGSVLPINLPAVREFWAQRFRPSGDESDKTHCVVCGQLQYPLRRMQMKVKGIRGGNKAGTALISGDVMAAQSYGLLESTVSSICFECGDRTTAALNHLLRYDSSHLSTGDSTFVYWTRAPVAFSLKILSDPQPADVEALLTSVQRGKPPGSVDSDAFYAAAFSGSGGRAVVRDWIDTTVDEAKRQVARWFRLQEIVAWNGERGEYLGLNRLAMATIPMRGGKADWARLSPLVPRQLLRTALTGEPLPSQLLAAAINRSRADRRVPRERAALVKVIILSRPEGNLAITKEKYMVGLDPEHPSGAYHCGRLLATLDRIQGEAIVSMEAGARVGARYFGTASSAPASVFPRLGRVAVHHLATLSHENPRSFRYLSRQLRDVLGRITVTTGAAELEASHRLTELPGFPPILTLAEQGLFLLGFYHQQAYRTTRLADDTSNPNINEQSDPDVDDNGCASDFCTGE